MIKLLTFLFLVGHNMPQTFTRVSGNGGTTTNSIALASGKILVGNSLGFAAQVIPSGQLTMDNAGAFTLSNASVIAKVLTGYSSGAGTISSSDSILQAIQKLNGNAVTLPIAESNVTNLVSDLAAKFSATGTTTNDNASSGKIQYYTENVIGTATNVPATATWGDAATLPIPAGDYDVSGVTCISANGATTSIGFDVGISLTTGNSSTGLVFPRTWRQTTDLPVIGGNAVCLDVTSVRFSLATATTIYLKHRFNYSIGTPQYQAALWFREVR